MLRLIVWATLVGLGVWIGTEVQRAVMNDRCLDAGGRIGARGICEGARPDD